MGDETNAIPLAQQYTMTFDAIKVFFQWRYYVLTSYNLMVAAVISAQDWLSEQSTPTHRWVYAAAAVLSATMFACDRINHGHIQKLYRLAMDIEHRAGIKDGVVQRIYGRPYVPGEVEGSGTRRLSYGRVLMVVYGVGFLVAAGFAVRG